MSAGLTRKQFLGAAAAVATGAGTAPSGGGHIAPGLGRRPRAIAMWDFSWLERRWPGAGFEDWDEALDGLVARGYDAVRIDCYPHLVAVDPGRTWLLKPRWDTQDWGAPGYVRVQVLPALHDFIARCARRGVRVGLSSWYRQDEDDLLMRINDGGAMAGAWIVVLDGIRRAGLLDAILYVDLCNEWPGANAAPFMRPPVAWGAWHDPRSLDWMRTAVRGVREHLPDLPILFSFDTDQPDRYAEHDISFLDGIEQHLWMAGENGDEFYKQVGYDYERFSEVGYRNMQLRALPVYEARRDHWRDLLTGKIARLAAAARRARQPLMTTEGWAVVDYKDWPMLPWGWVKDLCALGTLTASATGQWLAIATSNFCAPQFQGMWRDVAWHRRLTDAIKAGPVDAAARTGRLWRRL